MLHCQTTMPEQRAIIIKPHSETDVRWLPEDDLDAVHVLHAKCVGVVAALSPLGVSSFGGGHGILMTCPGLIRSGLVICGFAASRAPRLTPNRSAMPPRVSPGWMT